MTMTMTPTSNERREVAKRMRDAAHTNASFDMTVVIAILGVMGEVQEPIASVVADLIDPTCTYEHRNVADTFGRFMVTLGCGHRFVWYDGNEKLRYCPECGARVVDGED